MDVEYVFGGLLVGFVWMLKVFLRISRGFSVDVEWAFSGIDMVFFGS